MKQEEYDDPRFSYRVAFVRKTTSKQNGSRQSRSICSPNTETALEINRVFLKETEKKKYRPGTIVKQMKAEGYTKFGMQQHTDFWKACDGKNPKHQWGVLVEGTWFWYEGWLGEVRKHCQQNEAQYKPVVSAGAGIQAAAATA